MDSDSKDPLLTDVNNKFISCMEQFQKSTKVSIICIVCVCVCVRACVRAPIHWVLCTATCICMQCRYNYYCQIKFTYKQVITDLPNLSVKYGTYSSYGDRL